MFAETRFQKNSTAEFRPPFTCSAPGMMTGFFLGLVTKFLGVSDFHKFHLINQKHHKDEEELQDVSTAF